jgi:hypothetical protein
VFHFLNAARVIRSGALLLFASALAHSASITVSPTVTNIGGGVYQYAYSITYTGTDDAFLVDIAVPKSPTAITALTAPAGFSDQFDSVNGLVSFLENTSMFKATPTSGFSFDSTFAPGTSTFVASVLDSSLNISTISGTTLAPQAAATVPEPSSLYLLLIMAPVFLLFKRSQSNNNLKFANTNDLKETLHVSNC